EQEYFLVDKALYDARPDLVMTSRTLFGHAPAKGQQLEDHYFGSIPSRVHAFMVEFEEEGTKLGIPLRTRHNEVAPNQFECAPTFEDANLAVDHNQLLMDLMDRVAERHHFKVLLHEKPFAGVNGSGKHNNWAMSTDTGVNLFAPGKRPKENLQFLTFFIATIKAVHTYGDLLRASIASASNDHRLGANEAPPAIMSVFVGSMLDNVLNELERTAKLPLDKGDNIYLKLGIDKIPAILLDNTDRNRTSPFAFTGNKFELRAVGSSANSSSAMTVLNAIVAEQLIAFKQAVDAQLEQGKKKEVAIVDVLREYVISSKNVRFEGNGYSEEWKEEAARRGLANVATTPHALDALVTPAAEALFAKHGIFSPVELHARHEILLEDYLKKIQIE
ncbi:glutamine synthetase type III, partial [Hymenobacter crusticola]